jgi:hypothetical protein
MHHFSYDSDLIGGSLQVRESRVISDLLLEKADSERWQEVIQHRNRLQKRTSSTASRVSQALRHRLERLEAPFWRAIRDGDDELATQAVFCSALERNLLLVEFVETVVRDAYVTHAGVLMPYYWDEFLDDRGYRDPAIRDWKMTSRKKMGQVVYRMLAEVGLLETTRSMRLQRILIRPELCALLEESSRYRTKACLDVSAASRQ